MLCRDLFFINDHLPLINIGRSHTIQRQFLGTHKTIKVLKDISLTQTIGLSIFVVELIRMHEEN